MERLLKRLIGRLPIGWLQLSHSKGRFAAAVAGVAFANLLVFMQLGIMGAMNAATVAPYGMFDADLIISSEDSNTLTDGGNVARTWLFRALGTPGVSAGAPLFIGKLEFQLPDGTASTLQTFGLKITNADFLSPPIAKQFVNLSRENSVLLDTKMRGVAPEKFETLKKGSAFSFELNGMTVTAVGTLEMGGGFSADGTLFASDQTFLRLFGKRTSGAPNRILLKVDEGVSMDVVLARVQAAVQQGAVSVQSLTNASDSDLAYQLTERPTGIIFGFGVLIGIIVGIVIVYQVLSTDVANHLREYATFKAIGYSQQFFFSIVLEEAVILALFGFIPGFIVSMGLYVALNNVTGLPVEMDLLRIVLVFLGTVMACAISGVIATRRLAAADPADLF